ncbi:LysR family transcriptional regulator [Terrilactibacillus sp. BCM23-1]|uniref:LysR family transcriptional regulator n=1 Tax=Terrilactibacillus tamarindi TaxID=2599694 RepID=A0A6N8CPM1_9BACI|nr:LysR family transcriptional regulator [Terrilactibacillus tamarindi]MTT32119.1 LysR family transcriptional regulator [Terrilactibacillus tamarindi]
MELRNLKTFQVAAKHLNFTKAAKELNFTQPTVTSQIQSLENELGKSLFFRIGKQTFLTSSGKIVQDYAEQIFHLIEEMDQALVQSEMNKGGKIIIAASETFCTHYFPYIIREFLNDYPKVNIRLVSCHSNEVIEGMESNLYDIGIISGQLDKGGISNIVLSEYEDLVLIASKELGSEENPETLLANYPFIKYEIDGPFDDSIQTFIKEANISTDNIIEFSSLEAVKSAVINNIGIGLISRNLVKKELQTGILFEIKLNHAPVNIQTSLIIAEEKLSFKKVRRLIEIIKSNWERIHSI